MASKETQANTSLPGFTAAETVILAAAYFHARSADVDFDKVCAHVGSKSVASVRERLRLAKKKEVEVDGTIFKAAALTASADGEVKPGKVKTPRKTKTAKFAEPKADEDDVEKVNASENDNENDGGEMVTETKKTATKARGTKRKASEALEDETTGEPKKTARKTKGKATKEDGDEQQTKKAASGKAKANTKKKVNVKKVKDEVKDEGMDEGENEGNGEGGHETVEGTEAVQDTDEVEGEGIEPKEA